VSALLAAHGPRWARTAMAVGLRAALGPDAAEVVRLQGAAMLAVLPRRAR